ELGERVRREVPVGERLLPRDLEPLGRIGDGQSVVDVLLPSGGARRVLGPRGSRPEREEKGGEKARLPGRAHLPKMCFRASPALGSVEWGVVFRVVGRFFVESAASVESALRTESGCCPSPRTSWLTSFFPASLVICFVAALRSAWVFTVILGAR